MSLMRVGLLAGALLATIVATAPPAQPGTAIRLDLGGLVDHADLALEGRVVASRSFRSATGFVHTEYVVDCERTFWGEHVPRRYLRLPGGVLPDGSGSLVPGVPGLAVGESVVLFLTMESPNGLRMPVGLAQGKFRVQVAPDGTRSLVRHGLDLELLDPATGDVRPAARRSVRSYDEVIRGIEAAIDAKRRRSQAPSSTR